VSREGVVTRESLLFATYRTSDSPPAVIVNSVFVPRKIIWPREDRVARVIGRWIDLRARVRAGLGIAYQNSSG
jgi:hypothetical protein